jgi:hypothetical protein
VHDALRVRLLERFLHLANDNHGLFYGDGTSTHALTQRLALDELEHQKGTPAVFFQSVDGANVRMVQRCQDLGFAPEACEALVVIHDFRRQNLDRDLATSRPRFVSRAR